MNKYYLCAILGLSGCVSLFSFSTQLQHIGNLSDYRAQKGLTNESANIACLTGVGAALDYAKAEAHYPGWLTTKEAGTIKSNVDEECKNALVSMDLGPNKPD